MITCVCVTEGRPRFIERAIALFTAQTWKEKELVIMDSFHDPSVTIPSRLAPEIVYLRCPNYTQGKRLDIGMRSASGEILQKWDDDDVYGENFLSSVVASHQQENAVTYLRKCLIVTKDGELRVRSGRFAGGTLTLDKKAFRAIGQVSDIPRDVDGDVFRRCANAGVTFNPRHEYFEEYTYVRHENNTWNGMMQSRPVAGDYRNGIEHVTLDEHWQSLPVYTGAKREEVIKWLQR